jgi:hypothetical protein
MTMLRVDAVEKQGQVRLRQAQCNPHQYLDLPRVCQQVLEDKFQITEGYRGRASMRLHRLGECE